MPSTQAATGELQHGLVLKNMSDVAAPDELVEYAIVAEEAGGTECSSSTT